ncbi:unnamed protein product [Cunninghamella blakesleeana]
MYIIVKRIYIHISRKRNDIPDIKDCNIPEIHATVGQLQAIIGFSSSICCILSAGYYGSLSDRYGRRMVFSIHAIGEIITMIAYILLPYLKNNVIWPMLIVLPIIKNTLIGNSILGDFYQAYIADTTTPETRTAAFSHIIAIKLFAASFGPAFGGIVIKKTGSLFSVFYIDLIIYIFFLIYVTVFLPESLDASRMEKNKQEYMQHPKLNFFKKINLLSSIGLLFDEKTTKGSKYKMTSYSLPILSAIKCIITATYQAPFLLYGMFAFHWTAYEGGVVRSISSAVKFIIVMFIFPFLIKQHQSYFAKKYQQQQENQPHPYEEINHDDDDDNDDDNDYKVYVDILFNVWMIRIGMIVTSVAFILCALATNTVTFAIAECILGISILAQPTIKALYTSLVDPSLIGTLLGVQAILHSITSLLGNTGAHLLYSISVKTMPNLFFFVFAFLAGIGVLLSFLINPIKQKIY